MRQKIHIHACPTDQKLTHLTAYQSPAAAHPADCAASNLLIKFVRSIESLKSFAKVMCALPFQKLRTWMCAAPVAMLLTMLTRRHVLRDRLAGEQKIR